MQASGTMLITRPTPSLCAKTRSKFRLEMLAQKYYTALTGDLDG
jgi:hypothetical protein